MHHYWFPLDYDTVPSGQSSVPMPQTRTAETSCTEAWHQSPLQFKQLKAWQHLTTQNCNEPTSLHTSITSNCLPLVEPTYLVKRNQGGEILMKKSKSKQYSNKKANHKHIIRHRKSKKQKHQSSKWRGWRGLSEEDDVQQILCAFYTLKWCEEES